MIIRCKCATFTLTWHAVLLKGVKRREYKIMIKVEMNCIRFFSAFFPWHGPSFFCSTASLELDGLKKKALQRKPLKQSFIKVKVLGKPIWIWKSCKQIHNVTTQILFLLNCNFLPFVYGIFEPNLAMFQTDWLLFGHLENIFGKLQQL